MLVKNSEKSTRANITKLHADKPKVIACVVNLHYWNFTLTCIPLFRVDAWILKGNLACFIHDERASLFLGVPSTHFEPNLFMKELAFCKFIAAYIFTSK